MTTDDKTPKGVVEMGYQTTLMYGQYARNLADFAKEQAAEIRRLEKRQDAIAKKRTKVPRSDYDRWIARLTGGLAFVWSKTFAKIGEDWVFLALLGVIMAVLSFTMDSGIYMCNSARLWMYREITVHPAIQYLAWITLPVFLVLFAAGFVFLVAPQAVGSGIPEMKTIMRGVVLKEYLTFRTLIAKTVGLTAALGSGMPLGKEGPLVHIGSIVGTLLTQLLTSFKGIYENESRNTDMLAAACAVGVSCSLGAPIGGVLFSIEVTSVYFAIRNYWRGFFSAVFSALMFRLLAYWSSSEETLTAVFPTNFQVDFPYDPHELFIFTLIGVFGGLAGAFFVLCHRRYVLFMRNNKTISTFLKYNRFIYPTLVAVVIASLFYPMGFGRYLASTLTTKQQLSVLFGNFTWLSDDLTVEQAERLSHWDVEHTNLFISLGIFMMSTFFLNVLASTLPVPTGSLIPIFKMGAAFGRMVGEAMYLWFPEGIRTGPVISPILPGGYAVVGAAAFSAGVTHTVSICVVVAEMTGQIQHIIPILIAVLVSNAISTLLQPSLYESIILIKKLPYLPSIHSSRSAAHSIFVEDFMNRDIKYIWNGITYRELKKILEEGQGIRSFPLLDDPDNMILLGSIQRIELMLMIERRIGAERRWEAVAKRHIEARKKEKHANELPLLRVDPIPSSIIIPPLVLQPEVSVTPNSPIQAPVRRKVSRFEVVTTPNTAVCIVPNTETPKSVGPLPPPTTSATCPLPPDTTTRITVEPEENDAKTVVPPKRPVKSILKRTNSFTMAERSKETTSADLSSTTTYTTVTGAEGSKLRHVLQNFLRKQSDSNDSDKFSFLNSMTSLPPVNLPQLKKGSTVLKPKDKLTDMTSEEREEWEEKEMLSTVDFQSCHVDPAPFQLVERTSLLKVHSIFSLLGVHHAYVTTLGRLIGIVSLPELRKAIEGVNAGTLLPSNNQEEVNTRTSSTDDPYVQVEMQSNKEKESEIGSQFSNPEAPASTSRHVQFQALRSLSVSGMEGANVSESSFTSVAANSRGDNQS